MKKRLMRVAAVVLGGCLLFEPVAYEKLTRDAFIKTYASTPEANMAFEEHSAVAGSVAFTACNYDEMLALGQEQMVAASQAAGGGQADPNVDTVDKQEADNRYMGYENLGIAQVDSTLNVRSEASTDAPVVGRMENTAACEIEEESDNWAKITSGRVTGYVCTDYIVEGDDARTLADSLINHTVTVNTAVLRIREDSSTDSPIITRVKSGTTLTLISSSDESTINHSGAPPGTDTSDSASVSGDNLIGFNDDLVEDGDNYDKTAEVAPLAATAIDVVVTDHEEESVTTDTGVTDTGAADNDGWYQVCTADGAVGYVSADFVTANDTLPTAYPIGSDGMPIEAAPADTLDTGPQPTGGGQTTGAVDAQAVTFSNDNTASSSSSSETTSSDTAQAAEEQQQQQDPASYALNFVGRPYSWGGTSLTNGADCSGFVLSVYANYGISLPHSSAAQSNYGTSVSSSEAQPGDLFFYGSSGGINHVGIYIGGGQIVHASTPSGGIKVSSAYYANPVCVKRLME